MTDSPVPWLAMLFGQADAGASSSDTALRVAWSGMESFGGWPVVLALVIGTWSLIYLIPPSPPRRRAAGIVLGMFSLFLVLAGVMASLVHVPSQFIFWILSGTLLASAVAAISSPSPLYSAIWFALTLLATAGLFVFQGAQFLGVATVVVYAGAIVVTFLFVIMLAQPEGHDAFDRISWGWYTKPVSAIMAALLVVVLTFAIRGGVANQPAAGSTGSVDNVLHPAHMARFGGELFGKHLLSVELAGTLLLIALVGAIAILIQGGHLSGEVDPGRSDE
jgi:NADH-quinone oxidoreductase subunit J